MVLFGICALTPAVAWQIHLRGVPRPDSYMQALMGSRLAENTNATGLALQIDRLGKFGPLRVEALKEVVLPRDLGWRAFRPPLSSPSTWLLGGGLLAIAVVRLIRVRRPSDAYLLATLLILAVWPWHEGVRFIVPLIPIVVGYPLWLGLTVWRRRGGRSWERGILLLGLAVFIGLQTGGMVLVQCRLPVQRSKAVQRIATMQQAASWHAEHTPAGSTWLGVTRDLDDRKVLLLGAGYLSRRPVKTIDVQDDRSLMMPLGEESCVFLEESLLNSRADWGGYAVTDHVGPFAVLHPNKPPDLQFP